MSEYQAGHKDCDLVALTEVRDIRKPAISPCFIWPNKKGASWGEQVYLQPKATAAQRVKREPIKALGGHTHAHTHTHTHSQANMHVCVCVPQHTKESRSIQDLWRQGCIPNGLLDEIKGYNVVRPHLRKWSGKQAEKKFLPQHTHTRSLISLMHFVQSENDPSSIWNDTKYGAVSAAVWPSIAWTSPSLSSPTHFFRRPHPSHDRQTAWTTHPHSLLTAWAEIPVGKQHLSNGQINPI